MGKFDGGGSKVGLKNAEASIKCSECSCYR